MGAMPGRAVYIRMNDGDEHVFETRNEEGADRFVEGMRWVVARMSFNLVAGNLSVCCELLDVGFYDQGDDDETNLIPTLPIATSPKEEANWTSAMNDVTNNMVDKCSAY